MRRFATILLPLMLLAVLTAGARPRVAVVLGGGGAKGVAHAGILEAIEQAGIPIDMVVGTSMGAIIGGLYCIGYTPQQLDSLARNMDWSMMLSDRIERRFLPFPLKEREQTYFFTYTFGSRFADARLEGVIQGQNLDNLFSELTIGYHAPMSFDSLPIPFACVAVNVSDGTEYVYRRGVLQQAIRASMSIPGVFTPAEGPDGKVRIDGGMLNNYPVDVARSMGADIVIGANVQTLPEQTRQKDLTNAIAILSRMVDLAAREKFERNLRDCDLNISVDVTGYTPASFSKPAVDTLLRRGREAAMQHREELEALARRIGAEAPAPRKGFRPLDPRDSILISGISFSGVEPMDQKWLRKVCRLDEGVQIPVSRLLDASQVLRSAQHYGYVNYRLTADSAGGHRLRFSTTPKRNNSISVGMFFDTEEIASAIINGRMQFRSRVLPTSLSVTARLGKRLGIGADFSLHTTPLSCVDFGYEFRHNDVEFYDGASSDINPVFNYNRAEVSYSSMSLARRRLKVQFGLRYEYYAFKRFRYTHDSFRFEVLPEGFISYFAGLQYESLDRKYFPTRGSSWHADYTLTTDNFYQYRRHEPFSALSFSWMQVIPAGRVLTIIPSVYGRVLLGYDIPFEFMNFMGGDYFGRYMPQQMPFTGINHASIQNRTALAARIELRQRVARRHFITEVCNYALTAADVRMSGVRHIAGGGIGYGYDSVVGPLLVQFNISNQTRRPVFYAQFGFMF